MTSIARKAAWAGWLGSALEYYDFFLYATAASIVFGPLFFPAQDSAITALTTTASVGAGFISRPLGAFIIGPMGDRFGRRFVLSLTLIMMGSATFMIGILPTYADIGLAAPVLLITLRLIQGLAASSEHAGASTLIFELSPPQQRGKFTGLAISGTIAGLTLATLSFLGITMLLSEAELFAWGWRIPFLASSLVVCAGLWVRYQLPESPEFTPTISPSVFAHLQELWQHHRYAIIRIIAAAQVSCVSAILSVYSVFWAINDLGISKKHILVCQLASALISMLAIPTWAALSDRIGRKKVFLIGTIASGVLIWPFLFSIESGYLPAMLISIILLGGIAYSAVNGVWAALYADMFPCRFRLSGLAIGTQIGFTIAAQISPFAIFMTTYIAPGWTTVATMVSCSCALSAISIALPNHRQKA